MRLIGGARYTDEQREVTGSLFTRTPNGLPPGTPLPALLVEFNGDRSFSSTTWKAGLEYDVAPDNMLYLTVSTGFKAGGFNQTVAPLDSYDPEKLTAYELGSRNRFLDGRMQLNFELFNWDYKDNQIAHVIFDPLGNINLVTQNAGKATIRGANVDLQFALTATDRLRTFVEYNDASYDSFVYDTAYSIFGTQLFNAASVGVPRRYTLRGVVVRHAADQRELHRLSVAARAQVDGLGGLRPHVPLQQRIEAERGAQRTVSFRALHRLRIRRSAKGRRPREPTTSICRTVAKRQVPRRGVRAQHR